MKHLKVPSAASISLQKKVSSRFQMKFSLHEILEFWSNQKKWPNSETPLQGAVSRLGKRKPA